MDADGPPAELVSIDLTAFGSLEVTASADLVVERDGPVHAVVVTFRADLAGEITLTPDPWVSGGSAWSTSAWFLSEPIETERGTVLRVTYRRRVPGRADGLTCVLAGNGPDVGRG